MANVTAVHIPFQGGAPAINALLGNQIDVMAAILGGEVAGQIKSGQLRGVAVASAERARVVPEVPTFAEAGYTGMNFADWVGLFAPRGTSPSIIKLLNSQVENVLKEPEMLAKLDALDSSRCSATRRTLSATLMPTWRSGRVWSIRSGSL